MVAALALGGCSAGFGTGGTGEKVIPEGQLTNVSGLDLSANQAPIAAGPEATTTAPATQLTQPSATPATRPVLTTAPVGVSAAPVEVILSLEDVRRRALENNLDLKVELLSPEIARTSVTEEQARFEALFTANLDYSRVNSPAASTLTGSNVTDFRVDPGITIPLRTGGTLAFTIPFERFETNDQFSLINPAYTAGPQASLSVPLLRGFGLDVNAQPIRVAFYAYQTSLARAKLQVTQVLADADRGYWRLYAAREELKLRQQEHALAVAQLEHVSRQVKAGKEAPVEVVRSDSGVADKLEAIIVAENSLRDRQRELKRIMNMPGLGMETPTVIIPATKPVAVAYKLDPAVLAKAAVVGRMEMLEEELKIAEEAANVRVARNGLLPLVTLGYTYAVNGLGPTFDEALTQVRQKRFENHTVTVQVEVPIGNEAARSRLRRSLLSRTQALASRDQRALQVQQEVFTALDSLEANWQRIFASRRRVVLAARVLEVEQHAFDQHLRTSTEVLDAQTRLASARSDEISAVADYQISQVDIAFATGTVLGASHVVWQPKVAPASAERE